ncbi:MAG TPA: hypothetical protein ENI52_01325 [Thermoplasmata archaeon]|nr:hypothetical protein [Thermoplasmata archaeon]
MNKYEKIFIRLLYLITSRKFIAWAISTYLLYEGVIGETAWKFITVVFIGVELGQNWFEKIIDKKRR